MHIYELVVAYLVGPAFGGLTLPTHTLIYISLSSSFDDRCADDHDYRRCNAALAACDVDLGLYCSCGCCLTVVDIYHDTARDILRDGYSLRIAGS